jgi:hypothetical protein
VSANITINRHVDKVVQPNLANMIIEFGAPQFIHEGRIDLTQTCEFDMVKYRFPPTFDYYQNKLKLNILHNMKIPWWYSW